MQCTPSIAFRRPTTTSRRFWNSAVLEATIPAFSGPSSACFPASCMNGGVQEMMLMLSWLNTVASSGLGSTAYPSRQPVIEYDFEWPLTMTVLSRIPGSDTMLWCFFPSKTMSSYTSSE